MGGNVWMGLKPVLIGTADRWGVENVGSDSQAYAVILSPALSCSESARTGEVKHPAPQGPPVSFCRDARTTACC